MAFLFRALPSITNAVGLGSVGRSISGAVGSVFGGVTKVASGIFSGVSNAVGGIFRTVGGIFSGGVSAVKSAASFGSSTIWMIGGIAAAVGSAVLLLRKS